MRTLTTVWNSSWIDVPSQAWKVTLKERFHNLHYKLLLEEIPIGLQQISKNQNSQKIS